MPNTALFHMPRLTIFRTLLVLFVVLYATALVSGATVDTKAFSNLEDYQEGLEANFGGLRFDHWPYVWLWLGGQLVELAGLALLFCCRRSGLWLVCSGAIVAVWAPWVVRLPSGLFVVRTTSNYLLWGATCVCWGAFVCMALTVPGELFVTRRKSDHSLQ